MAMEQSHTAVDVWRRARLKTVLTRRLTARQEDAEEETSPYSVYDSDESCSSDDNVFQFEDSDQDILETQNDFVYGNHAQFVHKDSNGTDEKLISNNKEEEISVVSNNEIYSFRMDEVRDETDMAMSRENQTALDMKDMGMKRGMKQPRTPHPRIISESIRSRGSQSTKRSRKKEKFEPTVQFTWWDMLIGCGAIVIFFVDIGTDIELAIHYFTDGLWLYGGVTTGLIVCPSLITCFLGLHWYIIDYRKEKKVIAKLKQSGKRAHVTPHYVWFLRFLFTLLQCGPVIRIMEFLHCGLKSRSRHLSLRRRKRYYRFMLYEDVDSCLLRLFESFLEAAPQLTWQLYIVMELKPKDDVVGTSMRAAALLSSWGSLALSLVSYHRSLRNSHDEKAKMTMGSLPFYFIWRACEIGGRVICIASFISAFHLWVFGPLLFHWVFVSCWLMCQKTTFYTNTCLERVFNIICGYVMIFCFLNLREGRTRFRFLLFYFMFYTENFFMLAFWFVFTKDLGAWFHIWGFIVVLIMFVLHVIFQLLYYKFFHPTHAIEACLPCDSYIIYSSVCYDVNPEVDHGIGEPTQMYTVAEMVISDRGQGDSRSKGKKYRKNEGQTAV